MEKKEVKWYEAPAVEIVELESAGAMLAGSLVGDPDIESPIVPEE